MKASLYFVFFIFLLASCTFSDRSNSIPSSNKEKVIVEDISESQTVPEDSTNNTLTINREQARKYGISTHAIGLEIRALIKGPKKMTVVELLEQEITVQDGSGNLRKFILKELVELQKQ